MSYIKDASCDISFFKHPWEGGKILSVSGHKPKSITEVLWYIASFANLFHEYTKEMAKKLNIDNDKCEEILRDFITPQVEEEWEDDGDSPQVHVVEVDGSEDPKEIIKKVMEDIITHIRSHKKK